MTPDPSGAARAPQPLTELLAEVRGALQQATPGPWWWDYHHGTGRMKLGIEASAPPVDKHYVAWLPTKGDDHSRVLKDAELIAHAPRWLGALVQAVEDQQREIARLGQIAKDYDASLRAMPFASETRAERDRLRAEVAQLRADGQRLQRELEVISDLAALAEDNAVMAFPRSAALEECLGCVRDLRARVLALASPRNE